MINVFDKVKNIGYFDSIDEYINYLETETSYDADRDDSSITGSESFTGTRSFAEAIDLCKYGDEALRSKIYEQTLKFDDIDTVNKIKNSTVNDVVGFMPNVPNYIIGIPTNMIRDNRTTIKSKIVNVYINLSASAHVSADKIKTNASKYVAAINKLEEEGYRCNIYCGNMATKYNNCKYGVIVKIKSDKEPMNLAKMAFPLCHPSMLRRLSFKWIETIPIDFTHNGYGTPLDEDDEVTEILSYIFNDTKITVLSLSENGGDVNDVINILKKKGMVTNEGIA